MVTLGGAGATVGGKPAYGRLGDTAGTVRGKPVHGHGGRRRCIERLTRYTLCTILSRVLRAVCGPAAQRLNESNIRGAEMVNLEPALYKAAVTDLRGLLARIGRHEFRKAGYVPQLRKYRSML